MGCNSVLIYWFTPKYIKKLKNWQLSVEKVPKSASLLNPLNNPGLRFFPNMTPYTNDAPYCLQNYHAKNEELLMSSFGENFEKPEFIS